MKVARWTPSWEEHDLDAAMPEWDRSPLIDDVDVHHEWAREAARFAIVLGLHLDAEGTPIVTTDERGGRRQRKSPAAGPTGSTGEGWLVRRIHLDRIVPSRPGQPGGKPGGGTDGHGAPGTEGRVPVTVPVRGHLRRQAYGPGRAERRWIYVENYEARQWVAPRPLRIDVRADDDT